jgi:putative DNA primase/helicase
MDRLGTTRREPGSKYNMGQQPYYIHDDPIGQFKQAMLDAGITPPDTIIADGQLHRFKIDGKLNCAYILHLDGRAAGYFEDFKQGIKQNWKQSGKFMPLSEVQRQELAKKKAFDEAAFQAGEVAKHKAAASKAVYIWENAPPAPVNHPYLEKKHIGTHGARLGRDNALIIPLHNKYGELVNLQFISETGGKRFLSGGRKKGCFYCLGSDTNKILISEGLATGASLLEATGYLTVVAFDAGNLKGVAINIRWLYPHAEIVICGDNDESGVGQKKAIESAVAIGGKYIIPPALGDFNDMLAGGAV